MVRPKMLSTQKTYSTVLNTKDYSVINSTENALIVCPKYSYMKGPVHRLIPIILKN